MGVSHRAGVRHVLVATTVLVAACVVNTGTGPIAHASVRLEKHRGIDSCAANDWTTGQTAAYYSASPYASFGFYLGGYVAGLSCTLAPAGTSRFNTLVAQGWNLEPVWSDEQPSCNAWDPNYSSHQAIGIRTGNANQDGVNSGINAVYAAYGRGIGGPIWLDIDVPPGAQCLQATNDYVTGFINLLHYYGYKAAVYGFAPYLNTVATLGAPADQISVAYVTANISVYSGVAPSGLNPGAWTSDQREHQYSSQHYQPYGTQNLWIDEDCLDELVWGNTTHTTYSPCLT